jgi:hypothetical protein
MSNKPIEYKPAVDASEAISGAVRPTMKGKYTTIKN